MKPSALPEFRARALRGYVDMGSRSDATYERARQLLAEGAQGRLSDAVRAAVDDLAANKRRLQAITYGPPEAQVIWRMADLYYVTPEMGAVAGQASDTMPAFNLHRDDLPAEFGMLYYDRPFDDLDGGVANLWGPDHTGRGDMVVHTLIDRPDGLVCIGSAFIRYGADGGILTTSSDALRPWLRIVRCTWLLMQQRVASISEVAPERAAARRAKRAGTRLDPVRVIALRAAASTGQGDGSREYAHRWVVKGHWRRQWYATQDRHVPIWIAPFIKGPDGAPLLGGEKVYAWTR